MVVTVAQDARPYVPHGAAEGMIYCRDREVMIDGPAGTGKTLAVLNKALLTALTWPGCRIALLRKTRKALTDSVLVSFESKVVPQGWKMLDGPNRGYRRAYRHENGSELVISGVDMADAGAQAARAALMSTEFDLICCFEATELSLGDWEPLTTRLRNYVVPYQQIIADCNPQGPSHWLKARADRGAMTRFPSRHTDNPLLFDQATGEPTQEGRDYLSTLGNLTGHRKARLLEGKWVQAEGVVYPGFDAAVHLIDPFTPPPDWPRYRAVDFGFTNPFVCQWWATDPDGRLYLYRELYHTRRTVQEHARQILEVQDDIDARRVRSTVADHDAEDCETLRQNGVRPVVKARKDVRRGIDAVAERLVVQPDGKPRLFLMRDVLVEPDRQLTDDYAPHHTAMEWESYVYPESQVGKPDKEDPIKEHDHGMDALRYMVAHLDFRRGAGQTPSLTKRDNAAAARERYDQPGESSASGPDQTARVPRLAGGGRRRKR